MNDPHEPHRVAAIILAAGRGQRAGQSAEGPKQYRRIGGRSVLQRALQPFLRHPDITQIVVAIHPDDEALFIHAVGELRSRVGFVFGGTTRQDSTRLALASLTDASPDLVLIHDAARPFVNEALIDRVLQGLATSNAVLPAVPVSDTIKRAATDGMVLETVPRDDLHAAQTPQGFRYMQILAAHRAAAKDSSVSFTDDAAIATWAGLKVAIVPGSPDNIKLTWERDLAMAEQRLSGATFFPDVRTGNGYDVHSFEQGDHVMLCGVAIPHDRKLSGHSDADVGLHALTDALLATCGGGDIGTHFPPSDPQWRGAASRIFVEHAAGLVRSRGGRIANADVTLICEAPKIGPHRAALVASMAGMLNVDEGRVSVKATTNERLGFIGRNEGIAAIATATVIYPGEVLE